MIENIFVDVDHLLLLLVVMVVIKDLFEKYLMNVFSYV
jgi:hypothetical protein